MATAADAGGAVPRLTRRVVRATELLLLSLGFFFLFVHLPCAGAAVSFAFGFAASFAVQKYVFVVANAIVAVLFALFLREDDGAPFSPSGLLGWWPSDGDAQDRCLPFPGPQLMLPPPLPTTPGAAEEKTVFEDKEAVHVTTVRAQPPRRTRSEMTGGAAEGLRQAAAAAVPELRRVESENGRQLQPAAEPEVAPVVVEWGMDEESFRLSIEAFILRQQKLFQHEETAAAAKTGGDAPVAAGAVVVVK